MERLRSKSGLFTVSTCRVVDRFENPYETALVFKIDDDIDEIKVFEIYSTWEQAEVGHFKWIELANEMSYDDFNAHTDLVKNEYSLAVELMIRVIEWSQNKKDNN